MLINSVSTKNNLETLRETGSICFLVASILFIDFSIWIAIASITVIEA